MSRCINAIALSLAALVLTVFAGRAVRADDMPTSQPSTAPSGTITVTVMDSGSNPVLKASVKLYTRHKKSDADDANAGAPPAKPKAIASGRTDEDGKFTFSNVAFGEYKVNASHKKTGSKGSIEVAVTSDSPNPDVTITFASADTGGATTAPSAQAQ